MYKSIHRGGSSDGRVLRSGVKRQAQSNIWIGGLPYLDIESPWTPFSRFQSIPRGYKQHDLNRNDYPELTLQKSLLRIPNNFISGVFYIGMPLAFVHRIVQYILLVPHNFLLIAVSNFSYLYAI